MTRTDIINTLINKVGYKKNYLEIGLSNPERNYFGVKCANKECVDPFNDIELGEKNINVDNIINNVLTYRMTSDEFFEMNKEIKKHYDVIFIDGLHIGSQVVKDIQNAVKWLNVGGYIVVHDCIPSNENAQSPERENRIEWNGTTWKAIPELVYVKGLSYNTVNTDYGCCVIQKLTNDVNFSKYKETELNYNEVFTNEHLRDIIMQVISPEEFLNMYR